MITNEEIQALGWTLEKLNHKPLFDTLTAKAIDIYKKDNYWLTIRNIKNKQYIYIIPIDPVRAEFYEQTRLVAAIDTIKDLETIIKILKLEIRKELFGDIKK